MAQISTLRTISASALVAFNSARSEHQAAIDECVANYSDAHWDRIEQTEMAFRAARGALDQADAELLHAELVNVHVRKAA
jgi:hypothetical protein